MEKDKNSKLQRQNEWVKRECDTEQYWVCERTKRKKYTRGIYDIIVMEINIDVDRMG